jgi:hypothetical protein
MTVDIDKTLHHTAIMAVWRDGAYKHRIAG